ncbi:MAG: tetratricopeptide repeat protein, partial [Syntrophales bacterium]|nr:tetratricopeptide repeat protein [Syntrophales bacterium]
MAQIWGNPASTSQKKLVDSRRFLRQKNIQGCLVTFKQALEAMSAGKILPPDRKKLNAEIKSLVDELQTNEAFKNIFGPVTFSSSANSDVILSFIRQLIEVNTERLKNDLLEKPLPPEAVAGREETRAAKREEEAAVESREEDPQDTLQKAAEDAIRLVEQGKYREAREALQKNELLLERVVNQMNEKGIELRKSQNYSGAISEYKRVLNIYPDDEGIYYNVARAFYEKGDLDLARQNL